MRTSHRTLVSTMALLAGGLLLLALACGPATAPAQEPPPVATPVPTIEPTPKPTKDPRPITVPTGGPTEAELTPTLDERGLPPGLDLPTPEPKPTRRTLDIEYCRNLRMLFDKREYWDYTIECRELIHKTALTDCELPTNTGANYHELDSEQQKCLKGQYELVKDYAHRSKLGYPCLAAGLETQEEFSNCQLEAVFKPVNQADQWKDILTRIYASVVQRDAVVKAKAPLFECLTQQQKELAADDVATLQPLFWIDLLRDEDLRSEFHSWDSDRQGKIRQRAAAVDACAEKSGYYEVFHRELIAEIRRLEQVAPDSVEAITVFGWVERLEEQGYAGFKPRPDKF